MKKCSLVLAIVLFAAFEVWSDEPLVGDYAGDVGEGGITFLPNSMMDFAVEANGYSEAPIGLL